MIKPTAFGAALPVVASPSLRIDPSTFTPMVSGAIDGQGAWTDPAHPDWKQERLDVGSYKITHNLNFKTGIIVSANTANGVGSLYIAENTPSYFRVTTTLNGVPADLPIVFAVTQVVSLLGQP
jgi:hypothetical protein